jgi:hypothetical protein
VVEMLTQEKKNITKMIGTIETAAESEAKMLYDEAQKVLLRLAEPYNTGLKMLGRKEKRK